MNDQSWSPTIDDLGTQKLSTLWRTHLAVYAAIIGLASAAMWSTIAHMVQIWWNSDTFNHILLVPFIIAWLVWDRREQVAQVRPQVFAPGLVLLAGAAVFWMLGRIADVAIVQQFGWVFVVQSTVLAILGPAVTRALMFPLFYMIFLVPFGEELIPPLQHFTADFIVIGLNMLEIPVFLDGIFLATPSGNFEVAEACSGVRFLIATIALGALFANVAFKSWKRRLAVMALSLIVPIIANGLRAFGIVYVAYLTDNEYAAGVDHIVYGWGFFALVTILLLVIGMTFSDKSPSDPAIDVEKAKRAEIRRPVSPKRFATVSLAAAALLIAVPAYAHYTVAYQPPILVADLPEVDVGNGWQRIDGDGLYPWKPSYDDAHAEKLAHFEKNGVVASVYVAFYNYQNEDAELVAFGNTVLGEDEEWSWLGGGTKAVRIGDAEITAKTMRIRGGVHHVRDVWQVYWVNDKLASSGPGVKIQTTLAKLFAGNPRAAALVISTLRRDESVAEEEALSDFARQLPAPDAYFSGATGDAG